MDRDAEIAIDAATIGTTRSNPLRSGGRKDKDDDAACYSDYRQNLRDYRATRPPRVQRMKSSIASCSTLSQLILRNGCPENGRRIPGSKRSLVERRGPGVAFWTSGNVDCERDAYIRHLLSVDSDNSAAWMVAMDAARQQKDQHGFDSASFACGSGPGEDLRSAHRRRVFLHLRRQLCPCATAGQLPGYPAVEVRKCNAIWVVRRLMRISSTAWPVLSRWPSPLPSFSGLFGCKDTGHRPLTERDESDALPSLSRVAAGDTLIELNDGSANVLLIKIATTVENRQLQPTSAILWTSWRWR